MFRFLLGFFTGIVFVRWLSGGRLRVPQPMRVAPEAARPAAPEKWQQLRERYDWLQRFTDEELRDISFCEEGVTLRSGQQYFDLNHPERGVITARRGERASEGTCLIPRESVRDSAWQKLVEFGASLRRRTA